MKKESKSGTFSKGIGWVIEQLEKQKKQASDYNRTPNFSNEKPIRVCVKCTITWQHTSKPPYVEYYKDFTTYKLNRGVCPRCCLKT
ncbi:MAG: hypothetical protein Unbinned6224contig1001_7 [Prokaryotic dsDNA virus sp.]|nr:MAG: hypothetical protein Unbinned6224contig1001_7 [Prokaryotic dsDNA virus sp.]